MPAPPPPPPPTFVAPAASADGRGMLLQSIRSGKALKKTVTIDKSAPAISGKIRSETNSGSPAMSGSPGGQTSSAPSNNGGPPNLGGLFSGGMPKLKATGLRSNIVEEDSPRTSNPPPVVSAVSPAPSVKRGPPPVPPPATQKPQIFPPPSSLPEAPTSVLPDPPVSKGFGKPMLAPRPPGPPLSAPLKPSPPPKKLTLLSGTSVSRAQSMRLPRSPPVLAPTPPSLHQSQDCLNETTQHRPINRVLRPPIARPPSPPISKNAPAPPITRAAPPPPSRLAVTAPSMPPPPPPPPNRSTSMHQRLAPPPPPTPPTRGASASSVVRNGQSGGITTSITTTSSTTTMMTMNLDLENRFAEKFHSIMNFPNPGPFRGFTKVYNSKNAAKQQAPAPPLQSTSTPSTMIQLNASSGGKQWQHNAASSAC